MLPPKPMRRGSLRNSKVPSYTKPKFGVLTGRRVSLYFGQAHRTSPTQAPLPLYLMEERIKAVKNEDSSRWAQSQVPKFQL